MIRSVLLWPIKVAIIAATLWYFVRDPLPSPVDWIVAGVAAVLLHLAYAAGTTAARRSGDARLLQKAGFGEPLADGKRVALVGTLRASAALRAPFSGTECAGYSYEIFHFVYSRSQSDGTSSNRRVPDFSGVALAPTMIHTAQGDYALLSYPFLSGFPKQTFRNGEPRARAEEYVRATPFERVLPFAGELVALDHAMLETGGALKKDWQVADSKILGDITMTEQCIPADASVCAFGIYSAAKKSLIPDMTSDSRSLLLIAGDAEHGRERLTSCLRSSRALAIGSFVPAAAVVAFVLFAPWSAIARVPGGSVIVEKQTERLKSALWDDNVPEVAAAIRYLNPNLAFDEASRTPLMLARSVAAADLLVKRGANVSAHDANGYSVLMNVAERGNPDLLRFLVTHGADANEPLNANASVTPVSIARDNNTPAAVDALLHTGSR